MALDDAKTLRMSLGSRLPRVLMLGAVAVIGVLVFGGLGVVQPVIAAALAIALLVGLIVLRSPDSATAIVLFVLYSNIAVVARNQLDGIGTGVITTGQSFPLSPLGRADGRKVESDETALSAG